MAGTLYGALGRQMVLPAPVPVAVIARILERFDAAEQAELAAALDGAEQRLLSLLDGAFSETHCPVLELQTSPLGQLPPPGCAQPKTQTLPLQMVAGGAHSLSPRHSSPGSGAPLSGTGPTPPSGSGGGVRGMQTPVRVLQYWSVGQASSLAQVVATMQDLVFGSQISPKLHSSSRPQPDLRPIRHSPLTHT